MEDQLKVISGFGALERLQEVKAVFKPNKTLLVTGKGSYAACGAKAIIDTVFEPHEYVHFHDFEVNPKLVDAERAVKLMKDEKIDLILAVGGGSPMDIAKIVKALLNCPPEDAKDMVRGKVAVKDSGIPLVAIPTTAGSGSEATHFAVAYIGKDKFSLASDYLYPDMTILDGKLLASASPYQKAVNGLDAMAQSIESFWSAGSTEESRAYSLKAIKSLITQLPAIIKSNDPDALQDVMVSAHLAGKSINISKTTAPHAFSYALTGYHDVPHGHAVWLTLPRIFALHMNASDDQISHPKGPDYFANIKADLKDALGMNSDTDYEKVLKDFMRQLDIEPDMKKLGADDRDQRAFLSTQVNMQRLSNNPVSLSQDDINHIFEL